MARQLCYSAFAVPLWGELVGSKDASSPASPEKAGKECAYHLRHSSEWVIRLGDGTRDSHQRMQRAIDDIWMFTGEMFEVDETDRAMIAAGIAVDASKLLPAWNDTVSDVLADATLKRPADGWMISGGRAGHPHRAPGPHAGADAVSQARLPGSDVVMAALDTSARPDVDVLARAKPCLKASPIPSCRFSPSATWASCASCA